MKIHRSRHEEHFTILPNAALRDERLSYRARGVLMELLSRTPDWRTTADDMAKTAKKQRGPKGEGRDAMRGAFAELKAAGYIVVKKAKGEGGTHTSELHVYDTPQDVTSKNAQKPSSDRGTGFQSSDSQSSVDQASENQASIRRTDDGSTDERSTEEEESFRARSARSGSIASDQAREIDGHQEQQREAELNRRYNLVRQLTPEQLREALYAFEKKRPSIYRRCRQQAIQQYEEAGKKPSAHYVDQLSYMYAVAHYSNGLMPLCLSKPLGVAA